MTLPFELRPAIRRARTAAYAAALAAVWAGGSAVAAEHITLHNGFELTCDHRGILAPSAEQADARIRLYLNPEGTNYLDVAPEEILASEVFTPPPVPAQTQALAQPDLAPRSGSSELTAVELHELLASAGAEHHLDVDLLASLVQAESASRSHAVSRAGAQGLMQLMPATAAQLGVRDAFEPGANVQGGTAYLDTLLHRYHDNLALALAAYNAGPAAVDRYRGIPPCRETRAYVARIIHEFNRRYAARQAASALAASR